MNNQNFIADLILRFSKENPIFFKKLQKIAVIVGVASSMLTYLIAQPYAWPSWIGDANKLLVTICSTLIVFGFLPNKDVNQH